MLAYCGHVSFPIESIDRSLVETVDEGSVRMLKLRPIFSMIGATLGGDRNNFAKKIDSEEHESIIKNVFGTELSTQNNVSVALDSERFKIFTETEADALNQGERATCIALKYTESVALPLQNVVVGALKVQFGCGASLEIKREVLADSSSRLSIVSKSSKKTINSFHVQLKPSARFPLDRLFEPALPPPIPSVFGGLRSLSNDSTRYELPRWLTERFALFLQNSIRMHVLCTAVQVEGVSRPVTVDRARLHKFVGDGTSPPQCSVVLRLHASSASCICATHGISCDHAPRGVEVSFSVCGLCLRPRGNANQNVCSFHPSSPNTLCGDARLEKHCLMGATCRIKCRHSIPSEAIASTKTFDCQFPLNSADTLMLKGLIATALAMTHTPVDENELVHALDGVETRAFQLESTSSGAGSAISDTEMLRHDREAVEMLRSKSFYGDFHDGKLVLRKTKGSVPMTSMERKVQTTHSHLFFLSKKIKKKQFRKKAR